MSNEVLNVIQFDSKDEYERAKAAFTSFRAGGTIPYLDFGKIVPLPEDFEDIPPLTRVDDGIALIYADSDQKGKEEIVRLFKESCIQDTVREYKLKKLANLDAHPEEVEKLREEVRNDKCLTLEETLELGRKAIKNLGRYRARHWSDWREEHWGTDREADECDFTDCELTVNFITAWVCPLKVLDGLSKLGYRFTCYYADENLGCNCGVFDAKGDGTHSLLTADMMENPMEFAAEVWGY